MRARLIGLILLASLAACGQPLLGGSPTLQSCRAAFSSANENPDACNCMERALTEDDFEFMAPLLVIQASPELSLEEKQYRMNAAVAGELGDQNPIITMQRMANIQSILASQCSEYNASSAPH